jgi:hypothetical protein
VLDTLGDDERVPRTQDHRGLGPVGVPDRDVELAVEYEEELVGVLVDVPQMVAEGVRYPYVLVVHPGHDPRAVDLVEGGEGVVQVDRRELHEPIVVAPGQRGEADSTQGRALPKYISSHSASSV